MISEPGYSAALEAIAARGIAQSIRMMLAKHASMSRYIATMRVLGEAAGISQRHTNTLYGQFAGRVRKELGLAYSGLELDAIATYPAPAIDAAEEFSFQMRPAFAKALLHSGVISGIKVPSARRSTNSLETTAEEQLYEGTLMRSLATRWERNGRARAICISHFGATCQACGLSFERRYGSLGTGFIEVHHVNSFAQAEDRRVVDPTVDLVPVCSNCHRMLHRVEPALGIRALKKILGLKGRRDR
ncbi:MAG TPA: HNH endonuclease [Gemmatimonadaceae bacterium]|nr:HNH endonuclease [Gemmatimonadaceae bacterium]